MATVAQIELQKEIEQIIVRSFLRASDPTWPVSAAKSIVEHIAAAEQVRGSEVEALRKALLLSRCPSPVFESGGDETVEACIKLGVCGCDNKPALGL